MSAVKSTLVLSMARAITAVLNMWALGLYLSWMGTEGWGAIGAITVIGNTLILLCDLNMNGGVLNTMLKALEDNDGALADRIITTHRVISLSAAIVSCIVFVVMYATNALNVGSGIHSILFYLMCALSLIFGILNIGLNVIVMARRDYSYLALFSLFANLTNLGVSLYLVQLYRQPWGFVAGNFIGSFLIYLALEFRGRKAGFFKQAMRIYLPDYAPVITYVKKSLTMQVGMLFGGYERLVGGALLGQSALGVYDASSRIPGTLSQSIAVLPVIHPELVRAHIAGPEAFLSAYNKYMPAGLAMLLAVLFVPSGFGEPILQLFVDQYQPIMAILLVSSCLDIALSGYGSLFAGTVASANKPHLTAPYVWLGNLGATALAFPFAIWFGLIGIAAARLLVQVIQVYALEVTIKKHVIPELELRSYMIRKLTIFGLAGLAWGLAYALSLTSFINQYKVVSLPLAIIISYFFVSAVLKMQLVALPPKVMKLFPFIRVAN